MTDAPHCVNMACRKVRRRRPSGFLDGARGWCRACYDRWYKAGKPESGPPPPMTRSQRGASARDRASADREQRIQQFASFRARRFPVPVAARRVGVTTETAYKYSAELRRRQAERELAA